MLSYSVVFNKKMNLLDVLQEAFLKAYKGPPPMFPKKFWIAQNSYSKEQPGAVASLLSLLISSVNWLSYNINY